MWSRRRRKFVWSRAPERLTPRWCRWMRPAAVCRRAATCAIPRHPCQAFPPMTTANKITILRILLVPFFVVELIYYVRTGNEAHRLAAVPCFAVAAILDDVDGYIARRYNQISEPGKILDPLADKLLLVSGVVTLSFNHGPFLGQIPKGMNNKETKKQSLPKTSLL